jgi:hypothetical protein
MYFSLYQMESNDQPIPGWQQFHPQCQILATATEKVLYLSGIRNWYPAMITVYLENMTE